MSNKRFTMNPFGDLKLTAEDRGKLVDIANTLVLARFEQYEEYLNSNKDVDMTRWKKFKTSGPVTTYLERKKSSSDANLPEMLMAGPLHGTLDENMFGMVNPTLESMRIKASYLNDFSAAAVLASIVEPTEDEPFNAVVVKWMEIDIPGASIGIVRNRDYVYVESTGIMHLKNGDRVGYHILHSVNFPETHELPNKVRGNMSLSAIFHQEGPDRTDCRGAGIMDPKGDMIGMMAVTGMVHATMAGLKYSYCGQMKKLAWMLEQSQAEPKERGAPVLQPVCVTCSKPIKNSKLRELRKSSTTCKLFRYIVSKKLSFISPDLELFPAEGGVLCEVLAKSNSPGHPEGCSPAICLQGTCFTLAYGSFEMSSCSDSSS
ncbi:START-like domain [Phytophthora cactorum]|nr:START-like domain [Phytophthora cactorum]